MRIIRKPVLKLTPIERQACLRANYGTSGYMRGDLLTAEKDRDKKAYAVMLWDGPKNSTANMVGWALVSTVHTLTAAGDSRYRQAAQFYVKTKHRRKGYATRLMREVKKTNRRPYVYPHSEASGEFFSSYSVISEDKGWLVKKPKKA